MWESSPCFRKEKKLNLHLYLCLYLHLYLCHTLWELSPSVGRRAYIWKLPNQSCPIPPDESYTNVININKYDIHQNIKDDKYQIYQFPSQLTGLIAVPPTGWLGSPPPLIGSTCPPPTPSGPPLKYFEVLWSTFKYFEVLKCTLRHC